MNVKRYIALFLLLTCLLGACAERAAKPQAQQPQQMLGVRVDEEQIIADIIPAQNETISLVSTQVTDFLDGYFFGKGPEVVSAANGLVVKREPLYQDVTFSWSCTESNSGYTLAYATKADFSDVITLETQASSVTVAGLLVAKTYYWQVVTHRESDDHYSEIYSFQTEDTPRIVHMDNVVNVRDIGGYLTVDGKHRVAQGMIYRGGNLDSITGVGMTEATQILGIKTDLDLRSPSSESDAMLFTDKSPILQGVNYINISGASYSSAISSRMKQELEPFTKEENYPIYIHCKVGRDRTGTLVYILGALLGVPEETLLADYELTYLTEFAYASGDMRGHNNMTDFLTQFHKFPGDTLQQKAESFCLSIGMSQQQIQTIREIMLEEVA